MTEDAFQESVRNLRNHVGQLDREGDYWSDEERERLKTMFDAGIGITEISIRLQRTEPAVFQQIEKMDLYQRKRHPRRQRTAGGGCDGCHCPRCEVDQRLCPRCLEKQEGGFSDVGTV